MQKLLAAILAIFFLAALGFAATGCATDGERPRASPPPGSHSPFAGSSQQGDPSASMRDEPEPPPVEPEEEDVDDLEEER